MKWSSGYAKVKYVINISDPAYIDYLLFVDNCLNIIYSKQKSELGLLANKEFQ